MLCLVRLPGEIVAQIAREDRLKAEGINIYGL